MIRRRLVLIGAAVIAAACVEDLTAPGVCPNYCPSNQLTIVDTVLTNNISRDSAFRGYVLPHRSALMLAANLPGIVDGRAIFRVNGAGSRFRINPNDTTTGPILGSDSARLQLYITRRDKSATNLTLRFFRLPKTIDSTTTFSDLTGPFTDSLVRTLNIDTLLAKPNRKDSVTGDSAVVDTINNRLVLSLKFDSMGARYVANDSGSVAYGIQISADSLASIAMGTGALGPTLTWYIRVDSLGTSVPRTPGTFAAPFTSTVRNPPAPPIDSTLAVGGVPSARSILRVAFPRVLRDSGQIIRGTLILVPAVAAKGTPIDSFSVEVHTVLVDLGAKSPIAVDATRTDTTMIHIGSTDTVRIEVTNLLQVWASDSTQPTTLVLRAKDESQSFAEVRFYPSLAAAFRPALEVTFVRRFPFGGR
ncbi:MAG TPA: hypothetical protein VEU74_09340 [Gemmatimonadales bacterium]|nr:hypothetical protein [Gemmatimonadales bacterium]